MIEIIIEIVVSILVCVFCYIRYCKSENNMEKMLYNIVFWSYIILVFIYNLDKYNIPTKYRWATNIDTQNWLAFLGSYLPGIISAFVGAIVLIMVTIVQINMNREDIEKRDLNNLRIQNMPILKYSINTNKDKDFKSKDYIQTKFKQNNAYPLNISIKNVGANTIKKLKVEFESDINNSQIIDLLENKSGMPVGKYENIEINKWLELPVGNNEYLIKLFVHYQDVLSNWYEQEVHIVYKTTIRHENTGFVSMLVYEVYEEQLLNNK